MSSGRGAGVVCFAAAAALPVVLWHRVVADIASQFRLEPAYLLTGWTCWALMALGLACVVPAALQDWRDRRRRFYRRGTGAWYGWGVTLYVLGFGLATQVAQIADGLSAA
jgi:hypothetical protein